ncbi:MAG: hypothetical protein R3B45_03585 [Bdellovibrionota bacterium]
MQKNEQALELSPLSQKLWEVLLIGLKTCNPKSGLINDILEDIIPGVKNHHLPNISLSENKLTCNNISIDLSTSPLIKKTYEIFLDHPYQRLDRNQLIEKIYDLNDIKSLSHRRVYSCYHSMIKLISRARKLAESHFRGEELNEFEWFVYDSSSETWCLIKKKWKSAFLGNR